MESYRNAQILLLQIMPKLLIGLNLYQYLLKLQTDLAWFRTLEYDSADLVKIYKSAINLQNQPPPQT